MQRPLVGGAAHRSGGVVVGVAAPGRDGSYQRPPGGHAGPLHSRTIRARPALMSFSSDQDVPDLASVDSAYPPSGDASAKMISLVCGSMRCMTAQCIPL